MTEGILARKLGMTQVFNSDGTVSAVTVLEAGPCRVIGIRTPEKDGYAAARVGFGAVKASRVTKPRAGEFAKAGLEPVADVVEFRDFSGVEVGQELTAAFFSEGETVDVTATSKGKGFQGLIKRHRFARGPETHGSMNVRQPGSIGATDAARVFKGVRMAGQMGNERKTVQGLKIVRVDADRNLILLKGGVPGADGGLVIIKRSHKAARKAG